MLYHGNCHCGRHRFELQVGGDDTTDDKHSRLPTVSCTCVACTKHGCIWHVVQDGTLTTKAPPDSAPDDTPPLSVYRSGLLTYEFCQTCGTGLFGTHVKGPLIGKRLLNIRAIRDVNPFDYVPETPKPDESSHQDEGEMPPDRAGLLPSTGACLCGSVAVELLAPLQDMPLKEDNCSICTRNAWLGAYARKAQVVVRGAAQHTRDYQFGPRRFMGHPFCTTCGAHVFMHVYGPPAEVVARLPPEKQALVQQNLDVVPVNVRVLDGIQAHFGRLVVTRSDEGTDGYTVGWGK
ncbi:hypothetical protein HMPREF1624_06643 [Sporothrix schenckii ATCC 58251]|uniref:CENP-V/GFA domain-containing protein n=1 Tax=Sporothrix schenckii (strain ATCC 58251 / de Perez 2211183) TaxID=1391915 RepID=U7PQT9_SPOS1|nr:hypothetical protein HMPREF1624_06643 [Sporothrix schenckii ATCC 58251]